MAAFLSTPWQPFDWYRLFRCTPSRSRPWPTTATTGAASAGTKRGSWKCGTRPRAPPATTSPGLPAPKPPTGCTTRRRNWTRICTNWPRSGRTPAASARPPSTTLWCTEPITKYASLISTPPKSWCGTTNARPCTHPKTTTATAATTTTIQMHAATEWTRSNSESGRQPSEKWRTTLVAATITTKEQQRRHVVDNNGTCHRNWLQWIPPSSFSSCRP
mmetsp:Transcript_10202/g.21883  ORF Transcript_10202/g.21883 Transcript_10202/m.21883 type:complete len:217 (-) Transcript_10202:984-1634(-)